MDRQNVKNQMIRFIKSEELFTRARTVPAGIRTMQKMANSMNLPIEVVLHHKTWWIRGYPLSFEKWQLDFLDEYGFIPKGWVPQNEKSN